MAIETTPPHTTDLTPSRAQTLELSVFPDRPKVQFEGETYELKTPGDFSISEWKRFERIAKPLHDALDCVNTRDLTEAEETDLSALLDTVCRIVMRAPDEVQRRLGDINRLFVIEAFMPLLSSSRLLAGANGTARRSPGSSSSRGSSTSSGGTRSRGSRRSRSGSSPRMSR